ncbi:MAG: hypothetical protein QX199_03455 [Methylococcaceae bacterium]
MSRPLFKSTVVVGGMTLISRILGFIRQQMHFASFKLPNFFAPIICEGAFAHAFVPVPSDYKERGCKIALKIVY